MTPHFAHDMGDVYFGKTAEDYGAYRAGFPPETFERLLGFDIGLKGQKILDLGTGTGVLGRGFARQGAMVTGLDLSDEMLAQAKELDAAEGLNTTYVQGKAEETGFEDESFDVVVAGQCWHWFDSHKAAQEVRRLIPVGGKLAICHFDWLPLNGNVVQATENLILAFNPEWKAFANGTGFYMNWARDLADNGFADIETFSFDKAVPYSHEAWRGRIRASAGVGATLPPEQVQKFDAEHAAILQKGFPEDPLSADHRVFVLVCTKK